MNQSKTTAPQGVLTMASPAAAAEGSGLDVDRSKFDELVAELGLEDTLQTFAIFFREADNRLKRLHELSCDKDRDTIAQEAHALKGSAGNFGLRLVSELAKMLEQGARSITPEHYEAALRGLATSYAAARQRFDNL